MDFSQNEVKRLNDFSNLYKQTKMLILFSEELDETQKSNLQVIKEFRDAFDHIMRVIDEKLNNKNENDFNLNFDKAEGHLFRAAFDTVDSVALTLKEQIYGMLSPFDADEITKYIHDYGQLRYKIYQISENIAKLRKSKDTNSQNIQVLFDKYFPMLDELKKIYITIVSNVDAIAKEHRTKKRRRYLNYLILIASPIIAAILTYLLKN